MKHGPFQGTKPAEAQEVADINVIAIGIGRVGHRGGISTEKGVQRFVPGHDLVISRRDTRKGKGTV